jgi:mono/diheme cytochrome c family protein
LVPQAPAALVWDSISKEYHAAAGDLTAPFKFAVTNSSTHEVTINSVHTSCGCTVAKLPSTPWKLQPGEGGNVEATVDLRGKFGTLSKFVSVDTSEGPKMLTIKVVIPSAQAAGAMGNAAARARNMQAAIADRQAVFKNDCASCHVTPAIGKMGEPLFRAACGICHEDANRATMVPDLHALKTPPTRQYWEQWVTQGKPATLMPAFAQSEGGPLTPDQIRSLVDYLTNHFPQRGHAATAAAVHP